jgi:hypothetical protein
MRYSSIGILAVVLVIFSPKFEYSAYHNPGKVQPDRGVGCSRERASALISQQIEEARKIESNVTQIAVLVDIADRLWQYDEPKARGLVHDADNLATKDNGERKADPRVTRGQSASAADPRFTVIETLARHDKQWTRRLINSADEQNSRIAEKDPGARLSHQRHSSWLLQQLALSALTTDRSMAVDFMRDTFRYPGAGQLPEFLYRLAALDLQSADSLYLEALRAYYNEDITAILGLSAYPFGLEQLVGKGLDFLPARKNVPDGFVPNANLQQLFLAALFQRAQRDLDFILAGGDGPPSIFPPPEPVQVYAALEQLQPAIEKYQPELAPKAAQLKSLLGADFPPNWIRDVKQIIQLGEKIRDLDFPTRLAIAERHPTQQRRQEEMADAIVGGTRSESVDTLTRAAQKLGDDRLRGHILCWVYFSAAESANHAGRVDEAFRLAGRVDDAGHRFYLLLEVARQACSRAETKTRGKEILDAITKEAAGATASVEKAVALFGTSGLYAGLSEMRAFEVAEAAIGITNALGQPDLSRDATTWRFDDKNYENGWTLKTDESSLENAFRGLAAVDFERALALTQKISDKRSSAIAVLGVALGCLRPDLPSSIQPGASPKH